MIRPFLLMLSLMVAACAPTAEGEADLSVTGWARETAPGQTVAAAYLSIENRGSGSDRLVGVASPAAEAASLHSTITEDGIARMRAIEGGLELPPRSSVTLDPGGDHVMLEGLREPLVRGDSIELRLQFERSGERQVEVRVLEPGAHPETHAGH